MNKKFIEKKSKKKSFKEQKYINKSKIINKRKEKYKIIS